MIKFQIEYDTSNDKNDQATEWKEIPSNRDTKG